MNKNFIHTNVITNLLSIEEQLLAFKKDSKPERLHQLRIGIKRIKALFAFIKGSFGKKIKVKFLKLIFCQSGKIRALQINIQQLANFPHPPLKLIKQLKQQELILTQHLLQNIPFYIEQIHGFYTIFTFHKSITDSTQINSYFHYKQQSVKLYIENKKRKDLHKARKMLKKMIYLYDTLPSKLKKDLTINIKHLNQQQKQIGDWHDHYQFIQFIKHHKTPEKLAPYILKIRQEEKANFYGFFKK